MKKILTLVFILLLLKAGAQTSVHAVTCGPHNFFVRVSFTDSIDNGHVISTTTCADGDHINEQGGQWIKCHMELFADAACTLPVAVDPRFFAFVRDMAGSTGTPSNPTIIYINNCQDTIAAGSAHDYNYRIDYPMIYMKQCIWMCANGGYNDCSYINPGVPSNYNIQINCCFAPGTLAVHLTDFNGVSSPGGNVLSWGLENKVDFAKLELERSFDAVRYHSVYATTNATISTFIDHTDSTAYYRLKIYNNNGTFFISPVVVLKDGLVIRELKVSPSPFKDALQISVSLPVKLLSVFKLCSVEGKTVVVIQKELRAGVNNLIINVPPVCKGVYILTMKNSEGTVSKKVVKQ